TIIALSCDEENAEIYYTLDGSEPTNQSRLYTKPFHVSESCLMKINAFKKDFDSGLSVSYKLKKADYKEPVSIEKAVSGIAFDYYERFFVTTEDLDKVTPLFSGTADKIGLEPAVVNSYFGLKFKGLIKVPRDGIYSFFLSSNDGSRLFIDDVELIENDANHGSVEEPGRVALKAGFHKITVNYMQCAGGKSLQLSWSGPGINKQEVPAQVLFHEN
ncbi:MAG: PA14 domain-containing protein, partial [Draconibacterium sp.]